MQDLPDQSTQPVSDGTDRLRMAEAGHNPPLHDGEDRALGFYRSIGGLIEDAPHSSGPLDHSALFGS
jgi:hypothetical protein